MSGEIITDFHTAVVAEVGPQGLGHGPELVRVGQVAANQLGQPVHRIRRLRQLIAGIKLQIPAFAAAHCVNEDHGQALGRSFCGAETAWFGEHQVRRIHIGRHLLRKSQNPEIGPVAQLQKALVQLLIVAADDDKQTILRQHLRQPAGQALDGATAHTAAHQKRHPLVLWDGKGGPAG